MTQLPDDNLVELAKNGNKEAVAVLYGRHHPFLVAASRTYAGGALEPEDLVQEAWLRILGQLGRFTPRKSFRSWAITVLRNLGRDCATSRSRHRRLLEEHLGDILAARDDGRSLEEQRVTETLVGQAMDVLTARQRLALRLHVGERFPSAEVARAMQVTPPTVRTTCYFALQRVRSQLGLNQMGS